MATADSAAPRELDLAFCCDCTGSMGAYIRSAQENIRAISVAIHGKVGQNTSLRFALVKYRDHPPQDHTFITETFPFTEDIEKMKRQVDTMAANGGGDGPEAVAAALNDLNNLDWRPNATKVAVLIADAPPHGLGESGDGFPQGCPLGHDPIAICKALAAKSVTVYAVGVEPILSTSFKFARDFMMMVAGVTDGKFLPLGRASILAEVIVNGALEGACMQELWEGLEKEVEAEAKATGQQLDERRKHELTAARLVDMKEKPTFAQVEVENPYMDNYDQFNAQAMEQATSLGEARKKLDSTRNYQVAQQSAGYAWGAQQQTASFAPMQQQQQQRMVSHAAKKKGFFSFGSS